MMIHVKEKSLAVLADAYTSPLFLNTLVRDGIPAFAKGERLIEEFETFCHGLKLLDKPGALNIVAQPDSKLLLNSEIFLPCLIDHGDPSKAEAIRIFLDKLKFRHLLSKSFPDYFFTEARADELREISLPTGKNFVIKPSSGFSGIGVKGINGTNDLHEKADDLLSDVRRNAESLNSDLLSSDRFLIEEHIKGEEVACDAYFNSGGKPVILGIYNHPQLENDFRDILYYTSPSLVQKMHPRIEDFLQRLSSQVAVKNFPLHAEFRLKRNKLVPMEINPMKFGSFSLPDLTFFAFNLNPYRYYYNDVKPDWKEILSKAEDMIFFRVLSRLGTSIAGGQKPELKLEIEPDHDEFASIFPDLIGYCKLDLRRYPAYSIAFGRAENVEELQKYLMIDFNDYIS